MIYDIIIIGAGPSGMTAAIYALRANKKVLILEGEAIGGQIASSPLIENYPGIANISGLELANNLYEQVEALGGDIEFEKVIKLEVDNPKTVITEDNKYETKAIIIAIGLKHRDLGLDKEKMLIGKGISYCALCDGAFYKGKDVAILGGGNSALQQAIYLSDICNKVYIININNQLEAEKKLVDKVNHINNIELILNFKLNQFNGDEKLESIIIESNETQQIREIKVDALFISIGYIPQSNIVEGIIEMNSDKYIKSNNKCQTNQNGIFVAGDCIEKEIRQLTTAISDGTIAAIEACNYIDNQ